MTVPADINAYEEGYDAGHKEGYDAGYEAGCAEGYNAATFATIAEFQPAIKRTEAIEAAAKAIVDKCDLDGPIRSYVYTKESVDALHDALAIKVL